MVFLQARQCQMPTEWRFTVFLPQNVHVYLFFLVCVLEKFYLTVGIPLPREGGLTASFDPAFSCFLENVLAELD